MKNTKSFFLSFLLILCVTDIAWSQTKEQFLLTKKYYLSDYHEQLALKLSHSSSFQQLWSHLDKMEAGALQRAGQNKISKKLSTDQEIKKVINSKTLTNAQKESALVSMGMVKNNNNENEMKVLSGQIIQLNNEFRALQSIDKDTKKKIFNRANQINLQGAVKKQLS